MGWDFEGGGGGGAGLTLGPAPNTFTAATRAAAETLRDAGISAAVLAQYDASPTFNIVLNWPVTPTNTVYQARRAGAWADVTGIIRGPRGPGGAAGADGNDGAPGSDGNDGAPGTAGAAGADGSVWHYTAAAPASSLGVDGDWTLATVAAGGEFYQKVSGAWVLRFTADAVVVAGAHTRYFGIKEGNSRVIVTSDFADANTSTDNEGTFPANAALGYGWIAVPEDQGEPSEVYYPPNPINQIAGLDRQAGTVNDSNGDPHIVLVRQTRYPISTGERDVRIA